MSATADYDYVVRLIQFLDERHNLHPFISSRDFDVLYRWWEKHIPAELVEESIDAVLERARRRNRPAGGFPSFAGEVRKRFKAFLSLQAGAAGRADETPADGETETARFLNEFPPELEPLRADFSVHFAEGRERPAADVESLRDRVLALFEADAELNSRCDHFLASLAPELRRPDIRRTYRLNFLWRRFRIPALD